MSQGSEEEENRRKPGFGTRAFKLHKLSVIRRCDGNGEFVIFNVDGDQRRGKDVFTDNDLCDFGFEIALDISFKGTCAVNGVVSLIDDIIFGIVGNAYKKFLIVESFCEAFELDIDNTAHIVFSEGFIENYFIESVEELGTERLFEQGVDFVFCEL